MFAPCRVMQYLTSFLLLQWSGDSFTILGLWVLGHAVSHINGSQLQTYESNNTIFHDKFAIQLHSETR